MNAKTLRGPTPATTWAAAIGMLTLAGCASTAPDWEASFGEANRMIRAQQVVDADAPRRNTELVGMDGKAAAGVQRAYAESYGYGVKETKQPALSVSTSVSGR